MGQKRFYPIDGFYTSELVHFSLLAFWIYIQIAGGLPWGAAKLLGVERNVAEKLVGYFLN